MRYARIAIAVFSLPIVDFDSGLAVENPDKKGKGHRGIVSDILKQAAE